MAKHDLRDKMMRAIYKDHAFHGPVVKTILDAVDPIIDQALDNMRSELREKARRLDIMWALLTQEQREQYVEQVNAEWQVNRLGIDEPVVAREPLCTAENSIMYDESGRAFHVTCEESEGHELRHRATVKVAWR
jgi:hypothetical protein